MDGKSAAGSVTIVSAAVVLLAQVVQLIWGYTIDAEDQQRLIEIGNQAVTVATMLISIVGSISVIWGRWRAKRAITSVFPTTAPSVHDGM